MSVAERIRYCRLIEKMEENVEYAEKLGLSNSSSFREKPMVCSEMKLESEVEK